jgi:hypothetical protein
VKLGDNWQCPYCLHFQVLSADNFRTISGAIGSNRNKHKVQTTRVTAVECMNLACREICLWADFGESLKSGASTFPGSLGTKRLQYVLRPNSVAKPQHAAVPGVLVTDYEEACAVISASPKASATLSRRCLQGMIRDFCGISKATLHAEINELLKQVENGSAPRQVSEESIAAIDAVRQLGNIGAHFEKDINLIVDVEPDEAMALVNLTELLFQEWYVARYDRQSRLGKVRAIAGSKAASRAAANSSDEGVASETATPPSSA